MHKLLKGQLRRHLGEQYGADSAFQSESFQRLLAAIDRAYLSGEREHGRLKSANDALSSELATTQAHQKEQEAKIAQLANQDPLTGLPNRGVFNDRVRQAMLRAKRHDRRVSILFIDLDRFKDINDVLGHETGDLLLKFVAERLRRSLRESDTVARLGGDEFTISLDEMQSPNNALIVARRILEELTEPFVLKGQEIVITASIGIATHPTDGDDVVTLVKNAETAMYQAKEAGRNVFAIYQPAMSRKALENMAVESSLRKALEREEFVLYYQPQVDLTSGKLMGVEALIRWIHPEKGMIPPLKFIPLAEENGLILPIGEWVLRTACLQNAAWLKAGLRPIRMAVNISGRQLQCPGFVGTVNSALAASGLPPQYLELELTESTLMHQADFIIEALKELKAQGTHLSIDDFGTGFSSLSCLKRFPIDLVKIARNFIFDIIDDPEDAAITQAIIAMGHSLKMKVIAEGVETDEQLDFLIREGCDHIQGYWAARPMPAQELKSLLLTDPDFLAARNPGSQQQTAPPVNRCNQVGTDSRPS
ncbi:MAG: EAL domain-containing protein [Pseudomonadota bacterium]